MPTFQTYNVTPTLPATLEPLREMSFNLWWTWEPSARRLFRHLDPELWNRTNHNPVRMLQLSRQSRLEELSQDKTFLRELKQVFEDFEKYLGRHDTYGKAGAGSAIKNPIAYFSAEFGFHESIPNYSGGLGILASDHCKSASDLDLNSLRSVCSIGTDIFASRSIRKAFRERLTSTKIFIICRSAKSAGATRSF